jgi:uncharacterized protein DUF6930
MPKKRVLAPTPGPTDHFFRQELPGENPPSFQALRSLHLASLQLGAQGPWNVLAEDQLVLVRSNAHPELCYCSVMGALGESYTIHVYIGAGSFETFRKLQAAKLKGAHEFYASQHSVSLEFANWAELEKQDRELLAALGHPQKRGARYPVFRALRPGFYPWFVNAEEADILSDCIHAVSMVCSMVAGGAGGNLWDGEQDLYPLVSRAPREGSDYQIEQAKVVTSWTPPAPKPATVDEAAVQQLRDNHYPAGGAMEIGYLPTGSAIGERHERKQCSCVVLTVDAETGLVYSPELTDCSVPPADAMATAFIKAVQANRRLPEEVHVLREDLGHSLLPLLRSLNVALRVQRKLPAFQAAATAMKAYL